MPKSGAASTTGRTACGAGAGGRRARQAATLPPSGVTVHDDGDVQASVLASYSLVISGTLQAK
jgi:hypothetical protein